MDGGLGLPLTKLDHMLQTTFTTYRARTYRAWPLFWGIDRDCLGSGG